MAWVPARKKLTSPGCPPSAVSHPETSANIVTVTPPPERTISVSAAEPRASARAGCLNPPPPHAMPDLASTLRKYSVTTARNVYAKIKNF